MEYATIENKMLQSFEYETTINSDGNILGICELGKAKIQLINENNNYSTYKDSWINTNHGSFYIYDVKPVQENVTIELSCYDIKYKLDTLYDSSKHTFPCTLKEWRNSIFNDCGVTYDNSDFPNSDLTLSEEPYLDDGITNRNVIALIAQAGASIVITDNQDKFYFSWFNDTTHNVIDWLELTTEKNTTSPVNSVVLSRGDTGDDYHYPLTIPENKVEFKIDSNYILDPQDTESETDLRATTIIPIYNRINEFSYIVYSMRTQFIENKLTLKLGDKVKYKDVYGNELTSYIMSKKITWLGGDLTEPDNYELTISASDINETSTEASYKKKDLNKSFIELSRKADKSIGKIEDLVKKVDDNTEKTASLKMTSDSISQEVSSQKTLIDGLGETISSIQSVIQEQTDSAITTWFQSSGIQGTLDDLKKAIDNNDDDIQIFKSYITQSVLDDGTPYLELGKSENQTKIRILPERIQFLTNGEETAYISNNLLYINESTVLTRQIIGKEGIGRWITELDEAGNLNERWEDGV